MPSVRSGMLTALVAGALSCGGCSTTQPGVKSTRFAQYTTIDVGTAKATSTAAEVLNELGLQDVQSSSTNVDGWAKGSMADKTPVIVSLSRVSDTSSDISVKVGSFGDPSLGADIIGRVRTKLGIQPSGPVATPPASRTAAAPTQPSGQK